MSPARLVLLATAVAVAYLLFTAGNDFIELLQLRQDEASLRDEVAGLEERYGQLSSLRDYLNSDEYIEWVARRELGLVRKGEMGIIVLPSPAAVEEEAGSQPEQERPPVRWWEALIGE